MTCYYLIFTVCMFWSPCQLLMSIPKRIAYRNAIKRQKQKNKNPNVCSYFCGIENTSYLYKILLIIE